LGKEEDELLFKKYTDYKEVIKQISGIPSSEEKEEERNDVYIYKTLQYPPKSTSPTAD
jgi:hypothetical protein